jgi:ribA/ribD-fused uncharacterized protein
MITKFSGTYAYLSSFAPSGFTYAGIRWPTAEHAFQAMKNPDPDIRPSFAQIATPQQAKQAGRKMPIRHDWDSVKRAIMLEILLAKFGQNGHLRYALVMTGSTELVEGNHWNDTYWGAVPARNTVIRQTPGEPPLWRPVSHDPDTWLAGDNWLGRLLMMTREVLA